MVHTTVKVTDEVKKEVDENCRRA